METVNRKTTYRLYPTPKQAVRLTEMLQLHERLYNAALEQRIAVWRQRLVSVSYSDQCRELTALRAEDPEYEALNAQACQVTLKRLDLAFKHFFRRVKHGEIPGFPRFKALQRYPGWGYKTHGDGWKLIAGEKERHGRLRLSGIGLIRIRGKARTPGVPKTVEIRFKHGKWYASVTIQCGECKPERKHGSAQIGFDWGLESFLTFDDGSTVENPRFLRKAELRLKAAQKDLSRKKKGSRNRRRAVCRLSRIHERIANQRGNFLHQESARLVAGASLIATETLDPKNMTRSAHGTVENPGKNVRQKAGLNRSILDGAPGAFLDMVRYKAEEAGAEFIEVPTRKVKPSQTCPRCRARRKKTLAKRVHECGCGCVMPRDRASAQVCLQYALAVRAGTGPVWSLAVWAPDTKLTP